MNGWMTTSQKNEKSGIPDSFFASDLTGSPLQQRPRTSPPLDDDSSPLLELSMYGIVRYHIVPYHTLLRMRGASLFSWPFQQRQTEGLGPGGESPTA